jgi:hypothetical protein
MMNNYINTTDVFGNNIICSEDHWNNHVAAGSHKIMSKNKDAVVDTLRSPDAVYNSSDYANRKVFFKKSTHSSYDCNRFNTKVVVGYDSNQSGEIITAFPSPGEKGGIGDVIYPE